MTPRVSVVLPVFNGAQFLPACLESIFSQTQTDFEVVAADDGSTDASRSVLAACGDPRLRVLPDQPRQGLFRTMNWLIAEAKAPLIKPLCQDDQMLPSCLAETCAFMDQHPDIDMLFHKTVTIDQHDRVIEEASVTDLPPVLSPSEAGQHFFFHGCIPGNLSTVAFRRRAFDASGGFDVRYRVAGDYELWVRLCRDRGLGVLQRRLLKLRTHPGQLSRARSSGLQFIIENRRIRRTILPRLALAQRKQAIRFEQERHHVLEWHYAMRTLSAFRPMEFARVVRTLGLRDSLAGSLNWLLSGNNRWRRPVPPFE